MYQKRRFVLLLEMVIAMSLAITMLSMLSFFYYEVSLSNQMMDRMQNEQFQKRYFENRLASIFPKAIAPNDASKDFHFFTTQDSGGFSKPGTSNLIFSFDNGVQQDKEMSYHVIGRLFVDSEDNLVLVKWPAKKRWPEQGMPAAHKELLLEDVDSLEFGFYVPVDRRKQKTEEKASKVPTEIRGTFSKTWSKEYHELPAIIRLQVGKKNREGKEEIWEAAFPIPNTSIPITYNS